MQENQSAGGETGGSDQAVRGKTKLRFKGNDP